MRALDIISLSIFIEREAYIDEKLEDWKLNLEGLDLRDLNLEDVSLKGSRYDDSTQWPSGFDYINAGALGPRANLQRVSFRAVSLNGSNLTGADLRGADFRYVDLQEIYLYGSNCEYIGFDDADPVIQDCNVQGACFESAILQYAKFVDLDLVEVDFSNADIRGTDFSKARFQSARFDDAIYNTETLWPPGVIVEKSVRFWDNATDSQISKYYLMNDHILRRFE
ncbi:MAG: hypothetical protein CL916_14585 [Deltaproteobacteria bacterium]|nr:hypothetical protein [Deltaproteobacteria bacterium]